MGNFKLPKDADPRPAITEIDRKICLKEVLETLEKALDVNSKIYHLTQSPNIKTLVMELDEWLYPAIDHVRRNI